jgi:hypothetical protein
MTNVEAPISDDQPRSASAAVHASYKYAQTQTINAGGVNFAYRSSVRTPACR